MGQILPQIPSPDLGSIGVQARRPAGDDFVPAGGDRAALPLCPTYLTDGQADNVTRDTNSEARKQHSVPQ
jgi:hypothetical protein